MRTAQAVREAVSVPVLANGNIRTTADVRACLDHTGAAGVLSAESLLEDPALFSRPAPTPGGQLPGGCPPGPSGRQRAGLLLEYCDLADAHPTPMRMVTGHAFRMLGAPLQTLCPILDTTSMRIVMGYAFRIMGGLPYVDLNPSEWHRH